MILEAEIDRQSATTAVVRMSGRMTLGTRLREIEAQVDSLAKEGIRQLILDLAAVEYLDSAGLGVLMILYGRMKAVGGELHLVAPSPRVMDLLKLTNTDSIFRVDLNMAAALA